MATLNNIVQQALSPSPTGAGLSGAAATEFQMLNLILNGSGQSAPGNASQSSGASGRAYANSLYPDEIELYACALEIQDSDGNQVEYLAFPIMPKQLSENKISRTNVQETMAGVSITAKSAFIPFDIVLTGNFGRGFKQVLYINNSGGLTVSGTTNGSTAPAANGPNSQTTAVTSKNTFSSQYKTGYGVYKLLEKLIIKAQKSDINFRPYRLFFYNLSLNSNYMVEPIAMVVQQDRDNSNMIWNYTLSLKAVAPAIAINPNYKQSLTKLTDFTSLADQSTTISSNVNTVLSQYAYDQVNRVASILKTTSGINVGTVTTKLTGAAVNASAINSMFQLLQSPTELNAFSLGLGQGILNVNSLNAIPTIKA